MKRIVQYSGGLCSYFAARRVVAEHGTEGVVLLFADVLIESPGLYRFLKAGAKSLGLKVTRIAEGRTPWQVFKDNHFIGNARVDLCSRILKRELCRKWIEERCEPGDTTLYVGISWDEGRIEEITERWKPWPVEAPMCTRPFRTKCEMIEEARRLGLPLSEAYADGFPHDNCGGGCVKAGQAHFAMLYKIRPAVYAEWERNEADVIAHRIKDGYDLRSILRDRKGGETRPLTLAEFRGRIESGDYDKDEWGGCGCGV
jgi:hypothetical protein